MKGFKALLLSLIIFALQATPALAIAEPDTPPAINAVYCYTFDDGKVGCLMDYTLEYAATPTETATASFFGAFIDTDNTTQLKAAAPYAYDTKGYGRGVIWIPFTSTEVTDLSIDSGSVADYRLWMVGNPALTWTPGPSPPKTIGNIDIWTTAGNVNLMLALRILSEAQILEDAWSVDMVESTSEGNKLTTNGEAYFINVIANVRNLAPTAFADSTRDPEGVSIDLDTTFSATAASGTATVAGSPVTLVSGSNTITVSDTGTITITIGQYVTGNITNGTGTVSGSPVDLSAGVNTLTVTGAGDFTVALVATDLATTLESDVTGTGLDVTDTANQWGVSRWLLSGIVWLILSIVAVAALFRKGTASGKSAMLVFFVMVLGGTLLGLLHPVVSALLYIGYGAFIGYVLFFRSDSVHKGFMFAMWMFLVVTIVGNFTASQQSGITTTTLTATISASENSSIAVASTSGFPNQGWIVIGDEIIRYPAKDSTHFLDQDVLGVQTNPLYRGNEGTTAAAHNAGDRVRTKESYILNASIDYKIAALVDSAGSISFLALPGLLFDLVASFFTLPIQFLGTELAIIGYLWVVVAAGFIVSVVVALVGGRRVG